MAKKFDLAELMGARASEKVSESDTIVNLPVEEIHDNAGNFYVVDDVKDLCDSIAVSGVLQPILARPRAEGGYTLIAGHRRAKAVRQLREEWKGKGPNPYDVIPAILRPAPATKAEELLEDLALITTNSAARKLTDPELSRQAEKLTDILYGLKQEGYEFPGRMRKVVADALGVSETKLARQKVIREKLSPSWLKRWEAGTCPEYAAEALAKLEPEVQDAMLFKKCPTPSAIESLARFHDRCYKSRECGLEKDRKCDWGDHFWAVGSRIDIYYHRCGEWGSNFCCVSCDKALKCTECCPTALKAAKARKKRDDARQEKEKAERLRKSEAKKERAAALWARFKSLREAAGLSLEELAQKLRAEGLSASEGTFAGFEDHDFDSLYPWQIEQDPESYLSFKGVYLAAQLLGCPLAALTDVDWKATATEERIATGGAAALAMTGDGKPESGAAGTEDGGDLSAAVAAPPLEGEANDGQWPAWISVEDALPPAGVKVLTVDKDGEMMSDHREPSGFWYYGLADETTHWMPSPPPPGADRTLPPQGTDEGLFWRPYPKVKPREGQRALVVQGQSEYDRLIFEAKLARYAAEENRFYWVSEVIPDVEAERVEWWLPEPKFPALPEEADDEDPDE